MLVATTKKNAIVIEIDEGTIGLSHHSLTNTYHLLYLSLVCMILILNFLFR